MYPTTPFLLLAISGITLAQSDCATVGGPYSVCINAIKCSASLEADLNSCECSIALAQLECYNTFCSPNLPDLTSVPVAYSSQYCPSASKTVQLVTVTALPSSAGGASTTIAARGTTATTGATIPVSTTSKAAANGLVAPVGGIVAVIVSLFGFV